MRFKASLDFVDDSELAINEPKYVPETKVKGYCAIKGEVEIISAEDAPKKGRKAGSVNKPKVVVAMADGTTKMVSEAVAAKEKKKAAKAAENPTESATCAVCNESFPSRSKLFDHISSEGHAAPQCRTSSKTTNSKKKKK